jgi:hypothetical protein
MIALTTVPTPVPPRKGSPSMKSPLLVILMLAYTSASAQYQGVLVDAHNQLGCDIEVSAVTEILQKAEVDATLLSARNPCDPRLRAQAHHRAMEVVKQLPGRAFFMISTKIGMTPAELSAAQRTFGSQSYGFAEVLVQHAPHNNKNTVTPGVAQMTLQSLEIQQAIDIIRRSGKPLILHLEMQDFASRREQTLNDLERLLEKMRPQPVVLIHMAQMAADDVQRLIAAHSNIHFLTSHADPLAERGIGRRQRDGEIGQEGWITLFNVAGDVAKGRRTSLVARSSWKPEWQALFEQHPDRFVFAIDSVHANGWVQRHRQTVRFWRERLGDLRPETARSISCENARRLWSLPISC